MSSSPVAFTEDASSSPLGRVAVVEKMMFRAGSTEMDAEGETAVGGDS